MFMVMLCVRITFKGRVRVRVMVRIMVRVAFRVRVWLWFRC